MTRESAVGLASSRRRVSATTAAAIILAGSFPSTAAAEGPAPHRVRYVVTADHPTSADVYYRDTDPPTWAEYSHNPYQFSPKAKVLLGPDDPWVLDTALIDPDRWAMVVATSGQRADRPTIRCELTVDGSVVATHSGPKGALCSLRHW